MRESKSQPEQSAPLIHMGSARSLKPLRQSDWGALLSPRGVVVSGWRVLSPQRYALMSIVLLSLGLLYSHPLLVISGLTLTAWATRRAHLELSPERGGLLKLSSCGFTYARYSFPAWSPMKIERRGALGVLWLGSLESTFELFELFVCDYERAEELARLYHEGARRAQAHRLVEPPAPQGQSAVGEWQISLIELTSLLSGPRATHSVSQSRLTWWAPSAPAISSSLLLLALTPFTLLFAEGMWPVLLSLTVALSLIFGPREELYLSQSALIWRRTWLMVSLCSRVWPASVQRSLINDPGAPHGRYILIHEPGALSSAHAVGHSWDSDWIWSQLTIAQERSS